MEAEDVFKPSWLLHIQLAALEGCVMGVDLPEIRSKTGDRPVEGVEIAGDKALRNSV